MVLINAKCHCSEEMETTISASFESDDDDPFDDVFGFEDETLLPRNIQSSVDTATNEWVQ